MKKFLSTICGVTAIVILGGWGAGESNIAGDKKHDTNFYGTLETWTSPGAQMAVENISIDNLIKQIPVFVKPSKRSEQKTVTQAAEVAAKAAQKAAKASSQAAKAAQKAVKNIKKDSTSATDVAVAAQAAAEAATAAAQAATAASQAITNITPEATTPDSKIKILKNDPEKNLIKANLDLVEVGEIQIPNPDETWNYKREKGYSDREYIEIIFVSKDSKKTKNHYLIERRKKIYCDRVNAAGPEEQEVPLRALKSLKIAGYTDRKADEAKRKQEEEKRLIKKLAKKEKDTK